MSEDEAPDWAEHPRRPTDGPKRDAATAPDKRQRRQTGSGSTAELKQQSGTSLLRPLRRLQGNRTVY